MRQTIKSYPKIDSQNKYFTPVLKRLYKDILVSNSAKKTIITADFYYEPEDKSYEEILAVFDFLKNKKIILDYSMESKQENPTIAEASEGRESVDFVRYKCELIPKMFIEYLIESSVIPKYFIRIDKKEKITIVLNNKFILSNPRYGGPAYDLFDLAYHNPRKKLTRLFMEKTLEKNNGIEYHFARRLDGLLADLGFKKELRKIFFTAVTQEAVYFRNNVMVSEMQEQKINHKALERQLNSLETFVGTV